jgi:adenosylcobinamide kinase/adenosylcobinamide-phosphate guanylyltransferase
MSRIVLVTGGARSGKSAWAQRVAEEWNPKRVYIATSTPCDDEMRARIERHRQMRARRGWSTIEEPLALADALERAARDYPVALADCLTIWISNRMCQTGQAGHSLTEQAVIEDCLRVIDAARRLSTGAVFVSGEAGLGIVPENAVARRFRDLLGVCNQTIAGCADEVTLLVCGQPLRIK